MSILVHPTYFPNIAHVVAMVTSGDITFEIHDNYQKQTFRNRCDIYGANGKLSLTVPVSYTQKQRQLYKDVKIHNKDQWQLQHLKSLQSAYRTSPFYEYYEDELIPLFKTPFNFIMDLNFKCLDVLLECLQLEISYSTSTHFEKENTSSDDFRSLVNIKNTDYFQFEPYTQVFEARHGFINNLSILDLLFNEGPNAMNYLQAQKLGG